MAANLPLTVVEGRTLAGATTPRSLTIYSPVTVLVGPNGSGKTQFLRGLKQRLGQLANGKQVRFVSAGRIGLMERYRSDYDGQRGSEPNYKDETFGAKREISRRHQTETLEGGFRTLAAKPDVLLEVRERLQKLFGRDIILEWDAGNLKVRFSALTIEDRSYEAAREASGLVHLVGLLAALLDDEVGVLLLDEPEVSLHPQLQAFLLSQIEDVAGLPSAGHNKKIILLSTHSPEFLSIREPKDLSKIVFCADPSEPVFQISPDAEELKSRKIGELISRFGLEHKNAFFAQSPLFVEGPSDSIICSALAKSLRLHVTAAGSQILPVIGKGQIPTVTKLFRLMGKRPIVLADADSFIDSLDVALPFATPAADLSAIAMGAASAQELIKSVRADFFKSVDEHWALYEPLAKSSVYWPSDKDQALDVETKRRAAFSGLFCTESQLPSELLPVVTRLQVALDLLESAGCFFLRRGTIESYYSDGHEQKSSLKPQQATNEASNILEGESSEIRAQFSDIVKALEYASKLTKLSIDDLLKGILSSALAPIAVALKSGRNIADPNAEIRKVMGDGASLFSVQITEQKIEVTLKSGVIRSEAFPLTIDLKQDFIDQINNSLGQY